MKSLANFSSWYEILRNHTTQAHPGLVQPRSIPFPSGEGAGLIELLLGVQEDVIEAVQGQGHRLGLAIRGRTARPPTRSRHGGANDTILQRANDDSILWRSSTYSILFRRQQRQRVRGLVVERGAGAVLPPVLAVPSGELIGEHPVLGAVEGAELHQAAPAPAEDLLAGQRRREAELCIARRANDLHRRARRRQRRVGVVHGMDQVTRGIPRLGFQGLRRRRGRGTRSGRFAAAPGERRGAERWNHIRAGPSHSKSSPGKPE